MINYYCPHIYIYIEMRHNYIYIYIASRMCIHMCIYIYIYLFRYRYNITPFQKGPNAHVPRRIVGPIDPRAARTALACARRCDRSGLRRVTFSASGQWPGAVAVARVVFWGLVGWCPAIRFNLAVGCWFLGCFFGRFSFLVLLWVGRITTQPVTIWKDASLFGWVCFGLGWFSMVCLQLAFRFSWFSGWVGALKPSKIYVVLTTN